ncbi:DUF4244 domain-containing protein [Streptomyces hoynatensis]|uniref:DUF4244 domain-containing protein n=1 Tax=Streptomyces hoynatensis TaxID=1141874 RepID=A0A3A9Z6X4_9ACTN|nr:DUF4244 domain-containing protein [Streptomyces hoynatensis]RKN43056.1 DUF4244 domain-containing protein [Streptomyces hoynatensis]
MGLIRRRLRLVTGPRRDAGMSTAEYAVGTIAASAFGLVLYQVLTSGAVTDALQGLLERALSARP